MATLEPSPLSDRHMNIPTLARALSAALLALTLVACGDAPTDPNAPLPPLQAGIWHVQSANGAELPALAAHGTVEGRYAQTFLDSLQVSVAADGRWEQRAWLVEFVDGALTGRVTRQDAGAWVVTDTGYLFSSDLHGQRFVVRDPSQGTLALNLRAEGIPGVIVTTLRSTRPPASPTGTWEASAVRDRPLPDAIYVFDPTEVDGQPVSVHFIVDSARLAVLANGRYVHRTWASEWIGAVGGPPTTLRIRYGYYDHGDWTRAGAELQFESTWLQNHRMNGELGGPTLLRMQQGLTHGDPPVSFRYAR